MALLYNLKTLTLDQINKIVDAFLVGNIVILPTETVYGLCCLATNTQAVNKIYKIKQRNFDKPLCVLVNNIEQINDFAILKNEAISDLRLGTTVILPTKPNNFSKAIFGNKNQDSIGVRMPNNIDILNILSHIGQPIVATSVNLSGEPSLTKIDQLNQDILPQIDLILSGDEICNGKPSSIIDYRFDKNISIR